LQKGIEKVKILHLLYESKGDYFGIGGVGIRAYEIYKHLKDRHDITLLCKKYPGVKDGEIEGLKHIFVGTESKSLTKTLLSYAYHASQFVRKNGNEFDIIVEEFSPAIPTFLSFMTKKPIILQIQGYTGILYFMKYNPLYALTLTCLEQIRPLFYRNFIFVNQETSKKLLLSKNKNIEIIPNGISSEFQDVVANESSYVLYLGRVDIYGKGLDTLISAYKEFIKFFPEIKLLIAGDGRDMDKFKAMLKDLPEDVSKNIEMLGWISGQMKIDVMRNALFCVFPSRHEVQSIALLEAMACRKPVIVSDIPEFSWIVKSRVGVCFKTGDAVSLAGSMKDLMSSNEKREMGQRGRDLVKDFTWDKIALKYEEFLQNVLANEK
jgi:glycosyltransferase involved in cell wall biosynthesis